MTGRQKFETIDDYLDACSPEVRPILSKIRELIAEIEPDAKEKISYGMPAFTLLKRDLIYFAAFKKHIGIYPPVRGSETLLQSLERYRGEKGNLKFPLDKPMPYGLIKRVIRARGKELRERIAIGKAKRQSKPK